MKEIKTDLSLDWDELFGEEEKIELKGSVSTSDGLIMSLTNFGVVDIKYIMEVTKLDYDSVIENLRGSIYQNPERWNKSEFEGWETSDEYLSGNLYHKYLKAREANVIYNNQFIDNVNAIKSLMPKMVALDKIYVTLGTPWLPVGLIEQFMHDLLETASPKFLVHDEIIGTWEIKNKSDVLRRSNGVKCNITYGTSKISAVHVIEKLLNNQTIVVYENSFVYSNSQYDVQKVINKKETLLAQEKANIIKEEFKKFIANNEVNKVYVEKIYRLKMGSIRRRVFDGTFLTLPNINDNIHLYQYQKNAIARILFSPNTLLAHDVGAGKTFIMIAAGQELRRMGISKKNLYVVPNNILKQWESQFYELYPAINLKVVTPGSFTPSKRTKVLEDIRDNDYDAILMAYSSFDLIPLSKNYAHADLKTQIDELEERIENQDYQVTSGLTSKLNRLKKRIQELDDKKNKADFYFDSLNVNTLFVDEAHNYKNVPFDTKSLGILGVNSSGSEKCKSFFEKVKCVQKQNNGRGVVFATGTPITNSISDIYVMQLYLQSSMLAQMDLLSFDAWVGCFAETVSGFEVDVDTNKYRISSRFAKFHNLTELTSMLSMFSDFYQNTALDKLPVLKGYTDSLIPKSKELDDYLKTISERADNVRNNSVKRTEDNMLKITTDGRKAALDVRLVNAEAEFSVESKVYACSENVYKIYKSSSEVKGTQIVFCDTSTPKLELNMYDELKRLLLCKGIPKSEIAYIHEAKTDKEKAEMLDDTRDSKIRVLIGSTWKLGMGVNVQDHLIALHHLDVPWRPADMVQREGRIMRQGNLNKEVYIYRYITEGSFDAYSWQLLETKQRFITDLLSGSLVQRNGGDVGDTVLQYAEVKALAIGNPLIKERVETANELSKVITLKKRSDELRQQMSEQKEELPSLIEKREKQVVNAKLDLEFIKANTFNYSPETLKEYGEKLVKALKDNAYKEEERSLCGYNGFEIILPREMLSAKPYIVLKNNGRYKLDMSFSEQGVVTRLENFIKGFEKILKENEEILAKLKTQLNGIIEELEKPDTYIEQIRVIQERLKIIDKELGVQK